MTARAVSSGKMKLRTGERPRLACVRAAGAAPEVSTECGRLRRGAAPDASAESPGGQEQAAPVEHFTTGSCMSKTLKQTL